MTTTPPAEVLVPDRSSAYVDVSPACVLWGRDAIGSIADRLPTSTASSQRVLVVTGRTLATHTALLDRIAGALPPGSQVSVFDGVREHVPADSITAGVVLAEEMNADTVVALGGGSPVDSARLIALAAGYRLGEQLAGSDPSSAADLLANTARRTDPVTAPKIITVSTTLSGAEWTPYAGVTDPIRQFKHVTRHECYRATLAVLDATATLATPTRLWLSSGIRAVDHAVESLYSANNHPLIETVAGRALELLPSALRGVLSDPQDAAMRAWGQLGAWFSFYSIDTVMIGPSHALSHQIGTLAGVPHGITSCVLLPTVMEYLGERNPDRHVRIAAALGVGAATPKEASLAAAGAVRGLVRDLGLPDRLRDAGVAADVLPEAAHRATTETIGMLTSPGVELGEQDLLEILTRAY